MADPLDLEPDCDNCIGLCCVATEFKQSDQYAFSKSSGEPCRHLTADFRCGVHADLENIGMKGCAAYTCFGAGQSVTQRLFPDTGWRKAPESAQEIFKTFYKLKKLHELIWVLRLTLSACPEGPERETIALRLKEVERHAFLDAPGTRALNVDDLRRGSQSAVDGVHWNISIGRKEE